MTSNATSLDDIAESISDLSTLIANSISNLSGKIDKRFSGVESRLTSLESGQRDMNKRLAHVENETRALHADVVELYGLVR